MCEGLTLLPCPACGASDVVLRVDTRAYGFCHACGMCGPCAPKVDAEYAIRQWNSIPRALEWTDEPPKVPGCYLGRKKGGRISMVIYCFYQKDELGFWNGKKFCTFEQDATEYFGPIPEPREPKE
uniref:Restriction alleviation protein n=1 Tax=Myoviridae sp. ctEg02 TaxID=2825061 RepID=A0A8S5PPQ9_9CAUD|nr:MAG TPA: restriction alleviation protein [Myoviridae sp. ctEg02]